MSETEETPFPRHPQYAGGSLIAHNKLNYAQGQRPKVPCILCAVRDDHPDVHKLEVYRDELFLISVNLYPYNSGHLMIVPLRHVEWPGEFTSEEVLRNHELQQKSIQVLKQLYHPQGFNLGYNLGKAGGGSIPHLHLHIVPRYFNEVGFMSTVSNTQILVETPEEMHRRVRSGFETMLNAE